jgi:hypothetical protein
MSTYEPIARQAGNGSTSVTFSSIPQNYTDLILVVDGVGTIDQDWFQLIYNNDSTSGLYSYTYIVGVGGSASSARQSNKNFIAQMYAAGGSTTRPSNTITQIQNYSNSAVFKTCLIRFNSNRSGNEVGATAALWRNTAPITSITLFSASSVAIPTATTFTLYGVAAGNSSAKASGGNIVTTDGSFWYHTFTSSGVFIPSQALTCDYLVVAGGGAGGENGGGGGGAGGYRTSIGGSALSLSANTVYQTLIGAGAAGAPYTTNPDASGANGSNSVFSTITSTGGGGGGANGTIAGAGGSGGGGGGRNPGGGTGGAASPSGEGNAGGNGSSNAPNAFGAGGGGGSGAVGSAGTSSIGGAGGAGTANSISGSSITYAGGGGGGAEGGSGGGAGAAGGGNGGNSSAGGNATVNTGSGGGGAGAATAGGSGGSGIVIIRYAV